MIALDKLHDSLSTDAFLIPQKRLYEICRTRAGACNKWARDIGQEAGLTTGLLASDYYRRRGRCPVIGIPMTDGKGLSAIRLHHITPVLRGQAIRAAVSGTDAGFGRAADINNVMWVSSLGHDLIHFCISRNLHLGEFCKTLGFYAEHGSPLNTEIPHDCGFRLHADNETVLARVRRIIDSQQICPDAKTIYDSLIASGMFVTKEQVWNAMKLCGVNLRTYKSQKRVALLSQMLSAQEKPIDSFVSEIGMPRLYEMFLVVLARNGVTTTSIVQFRNDLRSAMQACGASIGTHNTQMARGRCALVRNDCTSRRTVYEIVKRFGRSGARDEDVRQEFFVRDTLFQEGHRQYVQEATIALSGILQYMEDKRCIDRCGHVWLARLMVHDAAIECGLTVNTLRRYHKIGRAPFAELCTSAKGRHELSFSYSCVDEWKAAMVESGRMRAKKVDGSNGDASVFQLA